VNAFSVANPSIPILKSQLKLPSYYIVSSPVLLHAKPRHVIERYTINRIETVILLASALMYDASLEKFSFSR
jgi:hypothetical protein